MLATRGWLVTSVPLRRLPVLFLTLPLVGALPLEVVPAPLARQLAAATSSASRSAHTLVLRRRHPRRKPLPTLRAPTLRHAPSVDLARRSADFLVPRGPGGSRSRRDAAGIASR